MTRFGRCICQNPIEANPARRHRNASAVTTDGEMLVAKLLSPIGDTIGGSAIGPAAHARGYLRMKHEAALSHDHVTDKARITA
jgi:hypothetical protein